MTQYLPYLFALAALGIVWDGLRRWLESQARRGDDKFITRDEFEEFRVALIKRCDKNTEALESHAKHAAEFASKTEARFTSQAIRQGRVS
jgi:hypothetical protein